MASGFIHYPGEDFAVFTWTGVFSLEQCLQAFTLYLLKPAAADIFDIRRLSGATVGAMDLFQLAQLFQTATLSGTYIPGKTAVVAANGETLAASAAYRQWCHLIAWVEAHQLPRELRLFQSMAAARKWLGK